MIKIIGIDPGLAATGVAVVAGAGVKISSYSYGGIYTSKKMNAPQRLDYIYSRLKKVIADEAPDLMVVEDVFSLENYPKSGILLGKVVGVILLAGCRAGLPVLEIPVREAKQVITGNGRSTKTQFEIAVRSLLNQTKAIRPFHASDALGLALIGFYRNGRNRIEM
ncbi:MAG: crossover junction endodeoxyribonuclease RuvC [Desulfobacterales bacterium]